MVNDGLKQLEAAAARIPDLYDRFESFCFVESDHLLWKGRWLNHRPVFYAEGGSRADARDWFYHRYYDRALPSGFTTQVTCSDTRCVRPAHLEAIAWSEIRRSRSAAHWPDIGYPDVR